MAKTESIPFFVSGGTVRAVIYLFVSILCFDVISVLVRHLSADYSILELSAYRNMLGMVPSIALLLWTGELGLRGGGLIIERWKLALFRGAAIAVAQFLYYTAIAKLELATVSALGQTNAFFVIIMAIFLVNEKVGIWRWIGVVTGFAGAVWILRPGTDAFSVYALYPIAASACYAYTMVSARNFGPEVSSALIYLYSAVTSAAAAIVMAFFTTSFHPVTSVADAVMIFAMGTIGGVAVLFLTLAYRMTASSVLATLGYFGILTAFFWGWLFFDEVPLDTLFPGVLLVVGSGILIIWRENRARGMG